MPLHLTKGHGTSNDFLLLDARDATADLEPARVRALCDRRAGIGADGVLRLVASSALAEGRVALQQDGAAQWFMDYRNADGSTAEMCGNGVRVFAAYLERLGLWDGTGTLPVGTRAGVRYVQSADDGWYSVDMGPWHLPGGAAAAQSGHDAEVTVAGLSVTRPGLRVDVGNPHVVLAVAGVDELAAADLSRAPAVEPAPESGTNVELVVPLGDDPAGGGRLRMRVHERGVGETWSCGTGACAAALAVRTWAGGGDAWTVEVPGGELRVRVLGDGHVELSGPAVLVAEVDVDLADLG